MQQVLKPMPQGFMPGQQGFTLVELLVAMVMIGIAFTALLYSQASNLKVSSQAKHVSSTKASASFVLERLMDKTLKVYKDDTSATPVGTTNEISHNKYVDQTSALFGKSGVKQSFAFVDYYFNCPTQVTSLASGVRSGNLSHLRDVTCSGDKTSLGTANVVTGSNGSLVEQTVVSKIDPNVSVAWSIVGETGFRGEGVLLITVTATHTRGPSITMINRISCYDIYPSPTSDVPAPCPPTGGGRPTV